MTQNSSFSVRLERSQNTFGKAMNEIRAWLDNHKIQPVEFKSDAGGSGDVAFAIRFAHEEAARLFEQAFT